MNLLIAGAGGILCKQLINLYLEAGHTVRALVLRESELAGFTHPALTLRAGDVTRPDQLAGGRGRDG